MKRSEINQAIREMEAVIHANGFHLPPFCSWTPAEWKSKSAEYDEIRDNMLGWDITDFGKGNFDKLGFALVTLRNGNQHNPEYKKVYAEKLLMLKEGQHSPMHFHWEKMEDIINRGGGTVIIHVYNEKKEALDNTDVTVHVDGRVYPVPAGTGIELKPGESITIWPHQYHDFDVKPGTGIVLLGEVSMCNDDNTDNRFYENVGRFPRIEEDEEPYRLLCNEYPKARISITKEPIFFAENRVYRVYTGGKLLDKFTGKDDQKDNNFPEEWIASTVEAINNVNAKPGDGLSIIEHTDLTLRELGEQYPQEVYGARKDLGILVKYLDSAIRLPLQVHPDKSFSEKYFNSEFGKTEMWVVLDTREDASICFGFKDQLSKEEFSEVVERSKTEKHIFDDYLNRVKVKPGEIYLIPGRAVHAIGTGCLMLEVQEPTDFTLQPEYWCGDHLLSEQE